MSTLPRILAGLALVLGLSGPTGAATVLHWSEDRPPDDPSAQMIDRIAKRLAETSLGRVTIQASLESEADPARAVADSALDMTTVRPGPVSLIVPAFGVLDAPYVWRDPAHQLKVMSGPIGQELSRELLDRRGLRVLGTTYFGARHVTTKQPVRAVGDMRGIRLRVAQTPVFLEMIRAWGATPKAGAPGTVPRLIRDNLVDAQEDFLSEIDSRELFRVQKYLVLTGHILMPRLILIKETAWQGLGPADQKALQDAVAEGIAWQNQEVQAQEKKLLDKLKQSGLEIIQPDVESFRKPVVDVMPKRFDVRWGAGLYQRIVDTQ